MSDSTKTNATNDLLAKTKPINHLATKTEKLSAAGASLPRHLSQQYQRLLWLSHQVRQALQGILSPEILADCYVSGAKAGKLTLSLSSVTAVNHVRYMMESCVQALRTYDQSFCQLQTIEVIFTPKPSKSDVQPRVIKKP